MKKILIIAVALLLLGGGGAYYFLFMRPAEQAAAAQKTSSLPEPIFFKLDTFVVPVMRGGGVDGFLRLEVTLEVTETEVKRDIERRNWKLRDAIFTDLHALVPLRRFSSNDRLSGADIIALKARIARIVDAQIGAGKVTHVLLEEAHDIPAPAISRPQPQP